MPVSLLSQRQLLCSRAPPRALPPTFAPLLAARRIQSRTVPRPCRTNDSAREPGSGLTGYLEVKVDSVRVVTGHPSIVFLRVQDDAQRCISVHIGELESQALVREIHKEHRFRPLTHDVAKDLLMAAGYRVTKIRITDIISDTYYARIHLGRPGDAPSAELDVDARPSDAINLALRFNAPMYIARHIANLAEPHPAAHSAGSLPAESPASVQRTVRETLSGYEDPTFMHTLQRELAAKEERFEDARALQTLIAHEMTHNPVLRVVVAMEAALVDGRYEEAARLRDEFAKLQAVHRRAAAAAASVNEPTGAGGGGGLNGNGAV